MRILYAIILLTLCTNIPKKCLHMPKYSHTIWILVRCLDASCPLNWRFALKMNIFNLCGNSPKIMLLSTATLSFITVFIYSFIFF